MCAATKRRLTLTSPTCAGLSSAAICSCASGRAVSSSTSSASSSCGVCAVGDALADVGVAMLMGLAKPSGSAEPATSNACGAGCGGPESPPSPHRQLDLHSRAVDAHRHSCAAAAGRDSSQHPSRACECKAAPHRWSAARAQTAPAAALRWSGCCARPPPATRAGQRRREPGARAPLRQPRHRRCPEMPCPPAVNLRRLIMGKAESATCAFMHAAAGSSQQGHGEGRTNRCSGFSRDMSVCWDLSV